MKKLVLVVAVGMLAVGCSKSKTTTDGGADMVTAGDMAMTTGDMATATGDMAVTEADMAVTEADMAVTEADMAVTEADMAVTEADMASSTEDMAVSEDDMASEGDMAAATAPCDEPSSTECATCIAAHCPSEYAGCQADATCETAFECLLACTDDTCTDDCIDAAGSNEAWGDFASCVTSNCAN